MSAPTAPPVNTRNATLEDLVSVLSDQHARSVDFVAPATAVRSENGVLMVNGTEALLTDDGVTITDGAYRPSVIADEGLSTKLGVPGKFLTGLRNGRVWMYDQVINGMLHGKTQGDEVITPPDPRSLLYRTFRGDDGGEGVLRAVLSDRYGIIDDLDVLTAVLTAVRDSGISAQVVSTDLTDRRMHLKLAAPAISALAPVLLGGYRNPFADPGVDAQRQHGGGDVAFWRGIAEREGQGYEPGTEPIVYAGLRISNSEVGGGAFSITPELRIKICRNGLVVTQDTIRNVHLGGRLEDGLIQWGKGTQRKNLELIIEKTRDAVRTFLNPEYLIKTLAKIEAQAGKPVENAQTTVQTLGRSLKFTDAEISGVLGHFIRGGQMTAGGVMNAITAHSQTVLDADRANELDGLALQAMALV